MWLLVNLPQRGTEFSCVHVFLTVSEVTLCGNVFYVAQDASQDLIVGM